MQDLARRCDSPAPAAGGERCQGPEKKTAYCNYGTCEGGESSKGGKLRQDLPSPMKNEEEALNTSFWVIQICLYKKPFFIFRVRVAFDRRGVRLALWIRGVLWGLQRPFGRLRLAGHSADGRGSGAAGNDLVTGCNLKVFFIKGKIYVIEMLRTIESQRKCSFFMCVCGGGWGVGGASL